MGVDFYLYQVKRRGLKQSDVALPVIEARFAFTEYPRFIQQLAQDAGIGEAWDTYRNSSGDLAQAISKRVFADFDPDRPFGYANKKERRRARKKERREGTANASESDLEIEALKQNVADARAAVESLSDTEPLVAFLLAPLDGGKFDGDACRRIGPRLRSIAEKWEPAQEGWVGWRERALEMAAAMDIAAEHPDVVFGISG